MGSRKHSRKRYWAVACVLALALACGGQQVWERQMGGPLSSSSVSPSGVTTDGSGNVIVTGTFYGTVNFGGGSVSTRSARGDMFLAKYSSTGVYQWVRTFGDSVGAADQL